MDANVASARAKDSYPRTSERVCGAEQDKTIDESIAGDATEYSDNLRRASNLTKETGNDKQLQTPTQCHFRAQPARLSSFRSRPLSGPSAPKLVVQAEDSPLSVGTPVLRVQEGERFELG
ncbi:hypothetical protein R1flu_021787 [Riccia fluitans]|uniref:Uncharacterized protein n=1 Tax=Riccia fluitans TaxID=41844 RepID=A0ABD1ZTI3_9MARC